MDNIQAIVFRFEDYKDLEVPLPAIIQVSKNLQLTDFNNLSSFLMCYISIFGVKGEEWDHGKPLK